MSKRLFWVLSVIAFTAPALAQQQSTSSSTFDSWVMACSTQTDKDNKTVKGCEIRSTIVVQDQKTKQQGVAAVLAIGRKMTDKAMTVAVQLPIAAQLNVPVKLTGADGKPIVELAFTGCQPQMCSASSTLTDAQVAAFRKVGDKLFIAYRNQAGQDIKLDVSTNGIGNALDALSREK